MLTQPLINFHDSSNFKEYLLSRLSQKICLSLWSLNKVKHKNKSNRSTYMLEVQWCAQWCVDTVRCQVLQAGMKVLIILFIFFRSIRGLTSVFVVAKFMFVGINMSSICNKILYGQNICFMLTKLSLKLVLSSNVAVTSDSTVTAIGPVASRSAGTESILGERMCAQNSQVHKLFLILYHYLYWVKKTLILSMMVDSYAGFRRGGMLKDSTQKYKLKKYCNFLQISKASVKFIYYLLQ